MSYVNPDVCGNDIIVPFKGKEVISLTRSAWIVDMENQGLSQIHARDGGEIASAACWCGEIPGSCVDCQDCDLSMKMTKINIGSGKDNDVFR